MQTIVVLLFIAVAAVSAQSRTASIRAHLQKSTEKDLIYQSRKGIKAVFQLQCFTGPQENGFELHVRRGDTFSRNTNGYLQLAGSGRRVADPGDDKEMVLTGSLSELTKTDTNEVCEGQPYGAHPKACSKQYCGRSTVKQFINVPGSVSPLAWVGHYDVDFCCLWSPRDPVENLIEPDVNLIVLSQCTTFGFEIVISPLPEPAACDIKIRTNPTISQKGMGYSLQNCRVTSDANPANVIPLVQNGRAVNGNGISVEARQIGSNIGRSYELKVHNLPVTSGKVDCDVVHCRFDNNLPTSLPVCPEGALPVENAVGKSFAPARTLPGLLNLRQGAVTLHVPNAAGTGQQACRQ